MHGAQGETVGSAHVLIGEQTGAASAYVAMTRGRNANTAHLVAESLEDARRQWIDVFSRDRADLGPAHARRQASDAIDRYGPDGDVALCAFAGLRRGEALGVQVGDIDFLARTLRVTRQLQRAKPADVEAGKDLARAAGGITVVVRRPTRDSICSVRASSTES